MYSSVLVVLLILIVTVEAHGDGHASFWWGRSFTLTCPERGDWFLNGNAIETGTYMLTHRYDEDLKDLHYYCKYSSDKFYHFYVRGRACDWCVEVTTGAVLAVLSVDLLLTGLVILVVYLRTKQNKPNNKNNHPTGATAAANKPAAGGRRRKPARGGPSTTTPSSDYEQLNIHTRSPDTYSTVHRMG